MPGRVAEDARLAELTAATQAHFSGLDFCGLLRQVDAIACDGIFDAPPQEGSTAASPASPRSSPRSSPASSHEAPALLGSPAKRARRTLGAATPVSPTSPPGYPPSPPAERWQERAQRAWEAGVQSLVEATMGGVVRLAVGEEVCVFVGGQWVPCTVCGYDAVHGLHELRDASGAVTPWIDLCAERWVYAHYFLGEDRFSQLAWMV